MADARGMTHRDAVPPVSLLVSVLALVVACSGTAVAAVALARGSVDTRHLKDGAVTSRKIANGTVRGADLAPDSRPLGALRVDVNGGVVRASGVLADVTVTHPQTGVYCVRDVPEEIRDRFWTATPSSPTVAMAAVRAGVNQTFCTATPTVQVTTASASGTAANVAFYLVVT